MVQYIMQYFQNVFSIHCETYIFSHSEGRLCHLWASSTRLLLSFRSVFHWPMASCLVAFIIKIVSFEKEWKGIIYVPQPTLVGVSLSRIMAIWCHNYVINISISTFSNFKYILHFKSVLEFVSRHNLTMGQSSVFRGWERCKNYPSSL